MFINSVRMVNFKCHSDLSVPFTNGLNIIVGENGAGKSTVIDAINFSLFGVDSMDVNKLDLVKDGADSSEFMVHLSFTGADGSTYDVTSTFEKKQVEKNGVVVADGITASLNYLKDLVKMDLHTFLMAGVINQGELDSFSKMRKKEKQDFFDGIFKIDQIDNAIQLLKAETDSLGASLTDKRSNLVTIEQALHNLKDHIVSMDEAEYLAVVEEYNEIVEFEARYRRNYEIAARMNAIKDITVLTCPGTPRITAEETLHVASSAMGQVGQYVESYNQVQAYEKEYATRPRLTQADLTALRPKMERLQLLASVVDGASMDFPWTEKQYQAYLGVVGDRRRPVSVECPVCGKYVSKCSGCKTDYTKFNTALERIAEYEKVVELRKHAEELSSLREQVPFKSMEEYIGHSNFLVEWTKATTNMLRLQKSFRHPVFAEVDPSQLMSTVQRLYRDSSDTLAAWKQYDESVKRREAYEELKGSLEPGWELFRGTIDPIDAWKGKEALSEKIREFETGNSVKKAMSELSASYEQVTQQISSVVDELDIAKRTLKKMKEFKARYNDLIFPSISETAKRFFVTVTNNKYRDLTLNSALDIMVDGKKLNRFSGGEKNLANLAIRLGIASFLKAAHGTTLNCLIADEISGSFSKGRVEETVVNLKALSKQIPQIILITHQDMEKAHADNMVEI